MRNYNAMIRQLCLLRVFTSIIMLPVLAACESHDVAVKSASSLNDSSTVTVSQSNFTDDELHQMQILSPAVLPAPPADLNNRSADDPAAARLGQKLFYDVRFSGKLWEGDNDGSPETLGKKGQSQRVSCAGCHLPHSGFSDSRSPGKQISLGASWGVRRAPSLLDVGQARLLMWDGSRDSLQSQAFGPLESPVEMNSSRLFMAHQAYDLYKNEYEAIFGPMPNLQDFSRFPALTADQTGCQSTTVDAKPTCVGTLHGMPGDHAEYDGMFLANQDSVTQVVMNLGKSIGAFERKLNCGPGRFDRFARGEQAALTESEVRGLKTFLGKGKCITCHSGPYFSDQEFHNVGLMATTVATVFLDANDRGAALGIATSLQDPLNVKGRYSDGDDGRLPHSVLPAMEGAFRTPTLRCSSQRPSFMHTGQMSTLAEVVSFFSQGGNPYGYPGKNELLPLGLSSSEQADLVNFLKTLDGSGASESLLTASQ